MTKVNLLLPSKATVLTLLFILLTVDVAWTQCTNPVPTGDNAQEFCKIDSPTITDLVAAGGTIEWYDAPTGGTKFSDTHQLEDGRTYYADDATGDGCSTSRLAVTVTLNGQEPQNVDVFVGKCATEMATIAQLSADGQNIEWYTESTGGVLLDPTHLLEDGETYWVQQTYNGCTSLRLPTTVSLLDQPAPTVDAVQNFCTDTQTTVGDLTPNGANIVWYSSENSTDPLDDNEILIHGEDYWAAALSFPCESTERTQTQVFLETPPDAGESNTLLFCEQDTTVTNLFDLLEGTPEPNGIWTGPTDLANGDQGTFDSSINAEGVYTYTVSTGTGICPDASATVTITIQRTASPTVTEANQTFCEIDNPTIADLVASGTSIEWFDSETDSTPLNLTDPLVDGEDYWASQTDSGTGCPSVTRVVVNVTVTTVPPPTVSNANQDFCSIENATVADLEVTGTNVVWYMSETSTKVLASTDALIDGHDYWAAEIGANGCESSSRVVVNVSIVDVATPTTTNPAQEFCVVDSPTVADLQVNESNIVWYDASTGGNVVDSTTALTDGGTYYAAQVVNSCESPNRLEITVTLNDTPAPTTANPNQAFCDIDGATIADLAITGTSVVWFDTETSTSPLNLTDALVDGEDYWAADSNAGTGCLSSVRVSITVTVTVVPPPTVAEANQAFCSIENATVADLAVTGTNVVWYDSEVSTTPLVSTDALIDGEDYWAADTSANGCESPTRVIVNVSIVDVATPTTANAAQEFCLVDAPTVANLQVNESNIVWYDAQTGGNIVDPSTALTNGTSYWASQIVNACESPSRLEVVATLNDIVAPTTSEPSQSFCELDNPTISDLNVNETDVVWYDSATSTTPLNSTDAIAANTTYWVAQLDTNTGCESSTRLSIDVVVTSSTPPTTDNPTQAFCLINNPTVAELQANETGVFWYANATDTTPLNTTEALVDGAIYYGSFFDAASSCEGPDRLMVTAVINDPAIPTSNNTNVTFCAVDAPTIALLEVNESDVVWYASESSTTPLSTDTVLADGGEYWAAQNDAITGCIGTERLQFTVTLTDPGTPNIIPQGAEFCMIDDPTVADLEDRLSGGAGTTVIILDAPNGNAYNPSDMLVEGTTYYAILEDASGCTSVNALEITVDLSKCDMYDVEFFDGFSPNGDGINESFNILNIKELYPDFEVIFFNRWGAEVYHMDASTPSWNGRLHGDGALVPSGVYFYVCEFNKDGRKPVQGKLILNR